MQDKDGKFTADSAKPVQLEVSGPYYVSMQFTDKKAEESYYNVTLNDSSEFYPLGNNSDDWGDMQTKGALGAVDDLGFAWKNWIVIKDECIGFGDNVDYKMFSLESVTELSLTVSAPNGPLKLSVCKLKETTKKGVTTYSEVTLKKVTIKANQRTASLNQLRLEKGDYYFKVESTDVKKSTGYSIQFTNCTFYPHGDDGWNDVLLDGKGLNKNAAYFYNNKLAGNGIIHFDRAENDRANANAASFMCGEKTYGNFAGFGDEIDFAKLTLTQTSDVTFTLTATGDATLEVLKVTKKGEKYTKKTLQTLKLKVGDQEEKTETAKKAVTLEYDENVTYYLSVKATNTKKTLQTFYELSYVTSSKDPAAIADALAMPETAAVADALAMPETELASSDSLGISDALSFGGYDTDALASASASALTDLDDKSAWKDITTLA